MALDRKPLRLSLERARHWAGERLAQSLDTNEPPATEPLLQAFVIVFCAFRSSAPDDRSNLEALAYGVADTLSERPSNRLDCDAGLLLLANNVLQVLDQPCAALSAYAREAAEALQLLSHTKLRSGELPISLSMVRPWYLLQRCGLVEDIPVQHVEDCGSLDQETWLLAPEPEIRSRLARIELRCGLDHQPYRDDDRALTVCALRTWTAHALYQYKLEFAATLLRAQRLLNMQEEAAFADAVCYLLAQQQPGGPFGYFEPEIARLREAGKAGDPLYSLYLPTTFSCVWLMAELATNRFSLLDTAP